MIIEDISPSDKKVFISDEIRAKLGLLEENVKQKNSECQELIQELNALKEKKNKYLYVLSEELHLTKIELLKHLQNGKEMKDEIVILNKSSKSLRREKDTLENDVNLAKRENELKEKEFIENLNEMKKVVKEKGTKIEALIQNNRNLNKQIIKVKKEGVVNISTKIPLYTSASSTSLVSSDSSSKALQTISNESSVSCQTNQIKFMSRSLPNLNSILWFQPSLEEIVRDEAEEVLANIYDNEVEDYYLMEREKIRKKRLIDSETD